MWKNGKNSPRREFSTPPPARKSTTSSPIPWTEKKGWKHPSRVDSFHVIHKVPAGDSPYVKAKHVQLIDKDPNKAISLFWSAINSGDRVDSALKDMAIVMKQLNRVEEAIEAIKSFRHLCPDHAQESLDNVLIDLYKRSGRIPEQIKLLQHKIKLIDEGIAFGGKRTKLSRSQGKKFQVSLQQEKARLLGNLAWAYMQQNEYDTAESLYRKAICLEPDKNKQCNLCICLLMKGSITEAKSLIESIRPSPDQRNLAESYIKSFDRASEMLAKLESETVPNVTGQKEERKDIQRSVTHPTIRNSKLQAFYNEDQNHIHSFSVCTRHEDRIDEEPTFHVVSNDTNNQFENKANCSGLSFWKWGNTKISEELSDIRNQKESFFSPVGGNSKDSSFKLLWGWQPSHQLLFADRQEETAGQKSFERGFNMSNSQNGEWIRDRSEEFSTGKKTNGGGLPFSSSVPAVNSGIISTVAENISQSPSINNNLRRSWSANIKENQTAALNSLNPKRSLESPMSLQNAQSLAPQKLGPSLPPAIERNLSLALSNRDWVQDTSFTASGNSQANHDFPVFKYQKSWADIVEEDEKELLNGRAGFPTDKSRYTSQDPLISFQNPIKWVDCWNNGEAFKDGNLSTNVISPIPHWPQANMCSPSGVHPLLHNQTQNFQWRTETFQDENLDVNIMSPSSHCPGATICSPSEMHSLLHDQTENLQRRIEAIHLKEGYIRSADAFSAKNPTVRRSLSFDQQHKPDGSGFYCSSPLRKKALEFGSFNGELETKKSTVGKNINPVKRRNRLQVFRDITLLPDSPRA